MDVAFIGAFFEVLTDVNFWMEKDPDLSKAYNLKLYKSSIEDNWRIANVYR